MLKLKLNVELFGAFMVFMVYKNNFICFVKQES